MYLSVRICQDGNCCSTGTLDSRWNDFENCETNVFERKHLGSCYGFKMKDRLFVLTIHVSDFRGDRNGWMPTLIEIATRDGRRFLCPNGNMRAIDHSSFDFLCNE